MNAAARIVISTPRYSWDSSSVWAGMYRRATNAAASENRAARTT